MPRRAGGDAPPSLPRETGRGGPFRSGFPVAQWVPQIRAGQNGVLSSCRRAPAWGSAQARGLPSTAPPSGRHRRGSAGVLLGERPVTLPPQGLTTGRAPRREAPGTACAPAAAGPGPFPPRSGAFLSPTTDPSFPATNCRRPIRRQKRPAPAPTTRFHPIAVRRGTAASTNQSATRGTNRQRARRGFKNAIGLINGQRAGRESAGAVRRAGVAMAARAAAGPRGKGPRRLMWVSKQSDTAAPPARYCGAVPPALAFSSRCEPGA